MKKDQGRKNERTKDEASRFWANQYISNGYYLHFHRNLEIYGVVNGKVAVTIDGQQKVLTNGQIAVVDGLENHCYEMETEAEVFYFHIGTRYLNNFRNLYPKRRLEHWLMDAEYNKRLYAQIRPLIEKKENMSELRRIGVVSQLFADIIEHYGTIEKLGNVRENEDVATLVVQYIYEHYQENITLETLSKQFFLSPKSLSKKIKKRINIDLRVFINDIRVQKAVEMIDDPKYYGVSISEIAAKCGFSSMTTFYRSYERNYNFRKWQE